MLGDEVSVLTTGPHIWALDDEPKTLELLETIFLEGGYQFTGFTNASDFLEHATSAEHHGPDLMLLDLMLPESSGIDVLRQMQSNRVMKNIPRVVLTADQSESSMINAFDAGAHDIIQKPFSVLELTARVKMHINALRHVRSLQRSFDDMSLIAQLSALDETLATQFDIVSNFSNTLRDGLDVISCDMLVVGQNTGQLCWYDQDGQATHVDFRAAPELFDALKQGYYRQLEPSKLHHMAWPPLEVLFETRPVECVWFVPVIRKRQLLAVMVLTTSKAKELSLSRFQRVVLPAANLAANSLARIRYFSKQKRSATAGIGNQLENIQDYLFQVIAASPNAIVAARRDGQIVIFNQTASDILGWTQEEALQMNVRQLYPPTVAESIMRRLRDPQRDGVGKLRNSNEFLRDRHDRDIPVMLSASIIYDDTMQEAGSVGVFTDIRRRIQLERDLQRAEADLEASRERAVMAELAGAAAHELNQPLTSLLAYVELLQAAQTDPERTQRALDTIAEQAQRLADLVNKLSSITQYRTRGYIGDERIIDFGEGDPS